MNETIKPLTGTEKQIEWARKLREEFAASLDTKRTFRLSPESMKIVKSRGRQILETETDATFWIDGFKNGASITTLMAFPLRFGLKIESGEYTIA